VSPPALSSGLDIFAFWCRSILTHQSWSPNYFSGSEQRVGRRRKGSAYLRYASLSSVTHPQTTAFSVLYDKAFANKLFEKDVEGMVSLFLARAGFEHRICLASLEDEELADPESSLAVSAVAQPFLGPQDRLSMLLDMLNNGIKTIRSGEHDIYA
jgi:hypothetical protein